MSKKANYVLQLKNTNGNFIIQWGSSGNGDGQFLRPTSLAIDFDGKLFIADSGNACIQVFISTSNQT